MSRSTTRVSRRPAVLLFVLSVVVTTTWALCSGALAHVTIEPPTAVPGSFTKVAFVVPNERPSAATTKIRVQFPQETPIATVVVRPVEGWTVKVEKRSIPPQPGKEGNQLTEAVNTITWEGGRIPPEQFEEFDVSLGPLPEGTDRLYFPTIQTYDNGEEVTWIERPGADGAEPPFPAPELLLTANATGASGGRDAHGVPVGGATTGSTTANAATRANAATPAAAPASSSSDGSTATAIAGLSLGVALVALVLGIATTGLLLRARRVEDAAPSSPAPTAG